MISEDNIVVEEETSNEQVTNESPTENSNESVPDTEPKETKTNTTPAETTPKNNKKLTIKEKKARAIEAFNRGEIDPEYRVIKMKNGKYRTYLRSAENEKVTSNPVVKTDVKPEVKPVEPVIRTKSEPEQHNPFNDIVYYNMNNQFNEQLSKRLDEVNNEIMRLKQKNTKLKGKYKQLKQVIYVTDDEDDEEAPEQVERVQSENQAVQSEQQTVQQIQPEPVSVRPRRTNGIDFNRYFV